MAENAVSQRFSFRAALGCLAARAYRLPSQIKNTDDISFF
jgi:hypothetical protein